MDKKRQEEIDTAQTKERNVKKSSHSPNKWDSRGVRKSPDKGLGGVGKKFIEHRQWKYREEIDAQTMHKKCREEINTAQTMNSKEDNG